MERTLTSEIAVVAEASPSIRLVHRLLPLGRYAAFGAILLGVLGVGAVVRLDVQQLRKDLDRTERAIVEARILHDRLGLETEARRRVVAMEIAATGLGLGPLARLDVLQVEPR